MLVRIMLPGLKISTKFDPCSVCRIEDDFPYQFVRCKHVKDCEEHAKTKENPTYIEQCQCKEYTSPCLSYSKIGYRVPLKIKLF